jgi:hypothetical protein
MRDEQPKVVVRKILPLANQLTQLHVRIPADTEEDNSRERLLEILGRYPGEVDISVSAGQKNAFSTASANHCRFSSEAGAYITVWKK